MYHNKNHNHERIKRKKNEVVAVAGAFVIDLTVSTTAKTNENYYNRHHHESHAKYSEYRTTSAATKATTDDETKSTTRRMMIGLEHSVDVVDMNMMEEETLQVLEVPSLWEKGNDGDNIRMRSSSSRTPSASTKTTTSTNERGNPLLCSKEDSTFAAFAPTHPRLSTRNRHQPQQQKMPSSNVNTTKKLTNKVIIPTTAATATASHSKHRARQEKHDSTIIKRKKEDKKKRRKRQKSDTVSGSKTTTSATARTTLSKPINFTPCDVISIPSSDDDEEEEEHSVIWKLTATSQLIDLETVLDVDTNEHLETTRILQHDAFHHHHQSVPTQPRTTQQKYMHANRKSNQPLPITRTRTTQPTTPETKTSNMKNDLSLKRIGVEDSVDVIYVHDDDDDNINNDDDDDHIPVRQDENVSLNTLRNTVQQKSPLHTTFDKNSNKSAGKNSNVNTNVAHPAKRRTISTTMMMTSTTTPTTLRAETKQFRNNDESHALEPHSIILLQSDDDEDDENYDDDTIPPFWRHRHVHDGIHINVDGGQSRNAAITHYVGKHDKNQSRAWDRTPKQDFEDVDKNSTRTVQTEQCSTASSRHDFDDHDNDDNYDHRLQMDVANERGYDEYDKTMRQQSLSSSSECTTHVLLEVSINNAMQPSSCRNTSDEAHALNDNLKGTRPNSRRSRKNYDVMLSNKIDNEATLHSSIEHAQSESNDASYVSKLQDELEVLDNGSMAYLDGRNTKDETAPAFRGQEYSPQDDDDDDMVVSVINKDDISLLEQSSNATMNVDNEAKGHHCNDISSKRHHQGTEPDDNIVIDVNSESSSDDDSQSHDAETSVKKEEYHATARQTVSRAEPNFILIDDTSSEEEEEYDEPICVLPTAKKESARQIRPLSIGRGHKRQRILKRNSSCCYAIKCRSCRTAAQQQARYSSKRLPSKAPGCKKQFSEGDDYNFSITRQEALEEQERLLQEAAAKIYQQQHYQQQKYQQHQYQQQQQQQQTQTHPNHNNASSNSDPTFTHPTPPDELPSMHWKYKCPFARLGLPKNATQGMIRSQYRKHALRYHPDKCRSENSSSRFQAVTEAYHKILHDG